MFILVRFHRQFSIQLAFQHSIPLHQAHAFVEGVSSSLLLKNMSSSPMLLGVSAAYLIIANANKWCRKKRSFWAKNYFKTRHFGIIDDLQLDEDILFGDFTRMSRTNFYSILKIIELEIVKQNTFVSKRLFQLKLIC